MIEIQVNGLVKSFEVGHNILDGITFQIDQGQRVGLLGKNGAGKSTLFKILTGELDYDEGTVTIAPGHRMGLISQIPVYPAGCTVEDVLYSFETCAATSVTKAVVTALSAITDIRAEGNTIIITLDAPNPDFLSYVSSVYIVPKGYDQQATAPVGTGPFRFASRSVQENFILERNEAYYGQGASLDKVTYKIYEDNNALFTALNSGALDLVAHLTVDQMNNLSNGYQVLEGTMNLVQALYLNNAVAPFDNELVRQALCYAIDRQTIMDMIADGHGTALGSSIYPAFTKYFLPELVSGFSRR